MTVALILQNLVAIISLFCVFLKCTLASEDLPGGFYLGETGPGRQGSPESTQAERHG